MTCDFADDDAPEGGVMVDLHLYYKPEGDLGDIDEVTGEHLRNLGNALKERLDMAASAVDRMRASGWSVQTTTFGLMFYHADIGSVQEAERAIRALGLNAEDFNIQDCEG